MQAEIRQAVKDAKTLVEVRDSLFNLFRQLRALGQPRIGYVSGVITSEGKEHVSENIQKLDNFTKQIRTQQEIPVFSATDVFDDTLFERLEAAGFVNTDWEVFWKEVLGTEDKFVTDMFMTPGWEHSHGASDEHRIAQQTGMKIYYLKDGLE